MHTVYVTTRQHPAVWAAVEATGRYLVSEAHVAADMEEYRGLLMDPVRRLSAAMKKRLPPPEGAEWPVWVTLSGTESYPAGPEGEVRVLEVPEEALVRLSVRKWSAALDMRYIPLDEGDGRRHRREMDAMGLSDVKACLSRFYPEIREKIAASWERVLDTDPGESCYGLLWEIRKEWLREGTV